MLGGRRTAHPGVIDALDAVIPKLEGERLVRGVALGHHHHARGARVEAVHDAGPQQAPDPREVAAVVEQGVHERAASVARRRVYDQARRLVEHEQRGVLVEDR